MSSALANPITPVRQRRAEPRFLRIGIAVVVAVMVNLCILALLVWLTRWQDENEVGRSAVRMIALDQPAREVEPTQPPPPSDPAPEQPQELEIPTVPPVMPEMMREQEPLPMLDLALPELGMSAVNIRVAPTPPRPAEPVRHHEPTPQAPPQVQTEPTPSTSPVAPVEPARPLALASGPVELPGNTRPVYPRFALRQGIEGVVHLKLLIGTDGHVREAQIERVEGPAAFGDAARTAAMRWRFRPARDVDGRAVEVWATKPVRFEIDR